MGSLSIRHECKSASVCRKKQRVSPCTTITSQILYVFVVWKGFSCVLKYVGQICWCRLLILHVCARILKHMYIHMMCNIRHAKKILRTFCTVTTTLSYKILEVGLYIFVMHVKENFSKRYSLSSNLCLIPNIEFYGFVFPRKVFNITLVVVHKLTYAHIHARSSCSNEEYMWLKFTVIHVYRG